MTSGDHQRKEKERTPNPTPRPVGAVAPNKPTEVGPGLAKLLVSFTKRHRGKAIELDASQDTMRVLGPRGEELAVVNSEVALDHLLDYARGTSGPALPEAARPLADVSPQPKPFHVTARGNDGREYEGLCRVVGRSGVFLELTRAPAVGTQLDMAVVSTVDSARLLRTKGTVAWICPHSDEFGFAPGVGVTYTGHSPESVAFLSATGAPSHKLGK